MDQTIQVNVSIQIRMSAKGATTGGSAIGRISNYAKQYLNRQEPQIRESKVFSLLQLFEIF
ncbi:MAG: hypothetical protein CVU62_13155 [Deltaproteobacteria bacterium HGW-Deltaproteobacteria-2]|nr:MAG: hypothetical protein CVU62_13155 [Deltaproteobacteria bacterium HGW-Deltaproteobacteria-2]